MKGKDGRGPYIDSSQSWASAPTAVHAAKAARTTGRTNNNARPMIYMMGGDRLIGLGSRSSVRVVESFGVCDAGWTHADASSRSDEGVRRVRQRVSTRGCRRRGKYLFTLMTGLGQSRNRQSDEWCVRTLGIKCRPVAHVDIVESGFWSR